MATGAQADELAALKAQLEALQARVSQLETQPAPALPAGASMLTVRRGQLASSQSLPLSQSDRLYGGGLVGREANQQGFTISVTPTADMPAPVSEVTVSGEVRALLLYIDDRDRFVEDGHDDEDYSGFDVEARGRLVVEGKTETAVGEVGGTIRLESAYDGEHSWDDGEDVDMDIAWGYWQMTPNFQLGGGYAASTGTLHAGVDDQHNNDMTGGVNAFSNADNEQIRITFQSGGFAFGIAVEDNDAECSADAYEDYENEPQSPPGFCHDDFAASEGGGEAEGEIPAIAAYGTFDTGSFVVAAVANWVQDERDHDSDDDWSAGIGVNWWVVQDVLHFTAAVAAGEGNATGLANFSLSPGIDDEWWGVTAGILWSFATPWQLQLGVGYAEVDRDDSDVEDESLDATISLFYDPVDQLTLGIGAGYHENDVLALDGDDYFVAGFGAYFRF
jgi:hypothetical protein